MPEPVVSDGLPEGWTARTVLFDDHTSVEVFNGSGFVMMAGMWPRDFFPPREDAEEPTDG